MKKINFIYGLLAIFFVTIGACKKDSEPNQILEKELKLETTQVTVSEGESKTINITSGNGTYKVMSEDNDTATATIKGNSVVITGKDSGTAKVTITDSKNKKAVINVTVNDSVGLDKDSITVKKGDTTKISISTEGKYTVKSSNIKVASVSINDNNVEITGVEVGEAIVTVTNTASNKSKTIKVIVRNFTVDVSNEINLTVDGTQEINVTGSDDYDTSVANDDVVDVDTSDNKITITAKKVGTTTLTITDSDTKQQVVITINVTEKIVIKDLILSAESVTVSEGKTTIISITSGNGNYEVSSNDDEKATVSVEGNKITIVGKKAGTTTVKVVDGQKKEATIKILVNETFVGVDKDKVEIKEGESTTVKISGDAADYTVKSADAKIAMASVEGNDVTITGVKAGKTTITITNTANKKTTKVTVIVIEKVVAKDLTLSAKTATVSEGKTANVTITSGNGDYNVTSDNDEIATASVNDNTITITGKKAGTATIKVLDAQSKEATIAVTVEAAEVQNSDITLSQTEIAIKIDEKIIVRAFDDENNDDNNYAAESADTNIATVNVNDNNIEITGVAIGKTTVTVTNTNTNATGTVEVTVSNLGVSETEISTYVGVDKKIVVTGSENYKFVNSNNEVVKADPDFGNKIVLKPIKAGTSVLRVIDRDTNTEVKVHITVKEPEELKLSKYEIEIPRKSYNTDVFIETYKHRPYEFMENGYSIKITEGKEIIKVEKQHYDGIGHHVKVISRGVIGTAKFKIIITETKQEKEVTVTVNPINMNILIDGNPKTKSLEVGATETVNFKGNGDYELSYSGDEGVVEATTIEEENADHAVLKLTALKPGTTTITITDSQDLSDEVEVTVTAPNQTNPDDFQVNADGVLENVKSEAINEEVTIPDNVKIINDTKFFNGESKIKKITMKGIVTLDGSVFGYMKGLTDVDMGENLKELKGYVFIFSPNITNVTVRATDPPAIGVANVFYGTTKENMTLHVPAGSVEEYKNSNWNNYFANIVAIQN